VDKENKKNAPKSLLSHMEVQLAYPQVIF